MRSVSLFVPIAAVVFLTSVFPADAAGPNGRYGWMTAVSDIIGDDASCGAGMVRQELFIREIGTENPATVSSALFVAGNLSDGSIVDWTVGPGPSVGPICYDPDTQFIGVDIDGGSAYRNFFSSNTWETPGDVPRGKLMRTTVWVTPTSAGGPDAYRHVSPSNIVLNTSPEYRIELNSFPSTYGATEASDAKLFVSPWSFATGVQSPIVKTNVPLNGGSGVKVLPAQTIPDDVYVWTYYLRLNGSNDLGGGFSVDDVLSSGLGQFAWPFLLDSTAPVLDGTSGHFPVQPYQTDAVLIRGDVSDALSGVRQVRIYMDGVLSATCDFFAVQTASCSVSVGPYPAFSSHTYYIEADDTLGNRFTGAPVTFTVGESGVCGSSHGVPVPISPSPSPLSPPNNICVSGTPSSIFDTGTSFNWTCDGSDGISASVDDAVCSATKSFLNMCPLSCSGGGTPYNTLPFFSSFPVELFACFGNGIDPPCTNDTAVNGDWDDTDAPDDVVVLSASSGLSTTVTQVGGSGSERVSLTYGGVIINATASVSGCVPSSCASLAAETDRYCPTEEQSLSNGCSGTVTCPGTRYCDTNWKEVTPGR
jgi:hypothetical protein